MNALCFLVVSTRGHFRGHLGDMSQKSVPLQVSGKGQCRGHSGLNRSCGLPYVPDFCQPLKFAVP